MRKFEINNGVLTVDGKAVQIPWNATIGQIFSEPSTLTDFQSAFLNTVLARLEPIGITEDEKQVVTEMVLNYLDDEIPTTEYTIVDDKLIEVQ